MTEKEAMNAWVQFAAAALTGLIASDCRLELTTKLAKSEADKLLKALLKAEAEGTFIP